MSKDLGRQFLAHYGVRGMRWGVRRERDKAADVSSYFQNEGLGHGVKAFDLKKPENLKVDTSRGFADVTTKSTFSKDSVRLHQEMVDGVEALRQEYPAVRAMKLEVAPMTHVPGGTLPAINKVGGMVLPMKSGEARIMYNDKLLPYTAQQKKQIEAGMPGLKYPGYTGRHEMGHVLAVSGGLIPPTWSAKGSGSIREAMAYNRKKEELHRQFLKKHKVSFVDTVSLGRYAASKPSEALAELYGHYSTPELRAQMSPALQAKAKAMFDELGGKT